MKKILFLLLFVFTLNLFPVVAQAQTGDTLNLYIQLLDQKAAAESITCVSLQCNATGEITQQILDSSFQAVFKDYPLEQFSITVQNKSIQDNPAISVTLYRGLKTQILHTDKSSVDISVAANSNDLSLGLIANGSGNLKLYTIAEKAKKAFATIPSSNNEYNPSGLDLKVYFQDTWGTANSALALKVNAGDQLKSNLDGEIYLKSLPLGTHKLTAYSKSGAKLAESYITINRKSASALTGSNPANPVLSAEDGQGIVYVLADIQDSLVKIRQISASPLTPGSRPEQSVVSVQGCLINAAQNPMPQVKLVMGDYSSTTNSSGLFSIEKLPVDQYQVVARDSGGKKIASSTLIMQKDLSTAIKDVTLNSASLAVSPYASTLFLTMQVTDDHALLLKAASDTAPSIPSPVPSPTITAGATAASVSTASSSGNSILAIYAYLFIAILALIVVVIIVLFRLRRSSKTKH
ncbi:MAG: carboxypeptidase-like regulatory domain-containing protein [Eubacteriales bacterium]